MAVMVSQLLGIMALMQAYNGFQVADPKDMQTVVGSDSRQTNLPNLCMVCDPWALATGSAVMSGDHGPKSNLHGPMVHRRGIPVKSDSTSQAEKKNT